MKRISQTEFIALMAMLSATIAFSIDGMLPALPEIGQELTPENLNLAQLILTSFVLGMGLGTMFTGPLSDRYGRKPIIIGGTILYIIGCIAAWLASNIEIMLAARVVQGLGAAAPRVVAMALIRDLYSGANMARIMSFVMVVFSMVPALAPTLGHYIMLGFGWRAIFAAFILFSLIAMLWLWCRQPETLAPENRRPLSTKALGSAVAEMFAHPTARLSILIQTLTFGMLFITLSSTQQIFDITFGQGGYFHLWFGGIAIVASSASLLNARLVVRVGMRAIIKAMYMAQIVITLVMVGITLLNGPYWLAFGIYVFWTASSFFQAGLTIGNLNALAMEDMGHIAGLAASVIAAVATVGAVFIAVPVGLMFDGTPIPMGIGMLICASLALYLTTRIKRPGEA
ncbi:multidrug effflux MFS transporter [Loktanella agnita]|uniref:multidrug effflux MFS transporter n=1 Tax=Loktanella agnita TaxID=287097 RepID=UPI003988E686